MQYIYYRLFIYLLSIWGPNLLDRYQVGVESKLKKIYSGSRLDIYIGLDSGSIKLRPNRPLASLL